MTGDESDGIDNGYGAHDGGGEGGATALAMTEGKGSSDVGDHDFGAELGCW